MKLNGVLKSLHPLFKTYQLPLLSPRLPEATSSPRLNPISQKDKTSDAQMSHFAVACLPGWPTATLCSVLVTRPRCWVSHGHARGLWEAPVSILARAEQSQESKKGF